MGQKIAVKKESFLGIVNSELLSKYQLDKYDSLLKKSLNRSQKFHFQDFYKKNDEISDEIKSSLIKKSLGELFSRIMDKEISFFRTDESKKLYVDSSKLKHFFQVCLDNFFEKTYEKNDINQQMLGYFTSFVLSLRVIKEIDSKNIVIEFDEITDKQAKDTFTKDLLEYKGNDDFKLSFNCGRGRKAADKFTQSLQLEARSKASKKSYIDIIKTLDNKLFDILNYHFQGPIFDTLNVGKTYKISTKKCINSHKVAYELSKKVSVRQFPPAVMLDLISLLEKNYQFKFPVDQDGKPSGKMLDPCGGWGAREVAAIAHSRISDYTVIEPNTKLKDAYQKIARFYNPITKVNTTVNVISKGVESVTDNDIGKNKFQLIFTSPPYRNAELYNDCSMTHYKDDSEWFHLITSLYNMSKYLDEGGLIVFNVAKYKINQRTSHDIPNDFLTHLTKQQKNLGLNFLNVMTTSAHVPNKRGAEFGEKFLVARKIPVMILTVSPPDFQPLQVVELNTNNSQLTSHSIVFKSKDDSPLKRGRTLISEPDNRMIKFPRLTHHEKILKDEPFIIKDNQQGNLMANKLTKNGLFQHKETGILQVEREPNTYFNKLLPF